ncbi:MAG: hypothetical protein PHV91_08050 [Bacteroidales bacterium]|nr:hypothetical protein [Bacteroidales bacterium]
MSYFLCISGYFPPMATWLSGAVSWLGAGNNPLPKNNSARRKRTTSHLFSHVAGCVVFWCEMFAQSDRTQVSSFEKKRKLTPWKKTI